MTKWQKTGKIRYQKRNWFGRKKMVLQVEEERNDVRHYPQINTFEHVLIVRWRDAVPDEVPDKRFIMAELLDK